LEGEHSAKETVVASGATGSKLEGAKLGTEIVGGGDHQESIMREEKSGESLGEMSVCDA
jgi:hypothetical protein